MKISCSDANAYDEKKNKLSHEYFNEVQYKIKKNTHKSTKINETFIILIIFLCFHFFAEADYTLDDSFWNEESPVGKSHRKFLLYDLGLEL